MSTTYKAFADDDMNNDPMLIARSKPMISIYKGKNLVDLIKIPDGAGLACKAFTLDAATGEVDREIKFYPKSRIIVGRVVNAVTGKPLAEVTFANYRVPTTDTSLKLVFSKVFVAADNPLFITIYFKDGTSKNLDIVLNPTP